VMVADINPGNNSSNPSRLVNVGGTLFFRADDGINGPQLWRSDGTAAGTVMVKNLDPGGSFPARLTNVNGVLEFFALDGSSVGLWRSDGTAAGTIEIATNANEAWGIGFAPQPVVNDLGGDMLSDMLWRNTSGALAGWTMNGGSIGASGAVTSGGAAVTPGPTWTVAGISDFNGDGEADALWRNSDGTLVDWTMTGTAVASSGVLGIGGVAVKPDASWTIAGTGDFDGDSHADILWRGADGTLSTWFMNGANIQSSGVVTSGGVAIRPDASWSVAGIGDFNGDNRRDVLWRNASGEVTAWFMNGSTIAGGGDLTLGGTAVRPDASWSVAGIGDFNHDGYSDVLWRRTDGSLAEWLMNGTAITGGGTITSGGVAVTPDASWHVVELGDFNGDSNTDILWRSDSGAMAEWLMNGSAIVSSVTPASGAVPVSPDPTWSTQAKPTNFG